MPKQRVRIRRPLDGLARSEAVQSLAINEERRQRRLRVLRAMFLMAVVLGVGTFGYWSLTDQLYSLVACFYMTVLTVSTVGFHEVIPVTGHANLQLFTSGLILFGAGTLVYFLTALTAMVIEGDLFHRFWRRRMEKRLKNLRDHVIVAGVGRNGREVVRDLLADKLALVVIDSDPSQVDRVVAEHGEQITAVVGDCMEEATLKQAHVEHARGLVATLPDDRDNLFLCLSARQLSPMMRIVSKLEALGNEEKFYKVGANAVVSPVRMGARRLANEMVRPAVLDLVEALRDAASSLDVREMLIAEGSPFAGRTLAELDRTEGTLCAVVAVRERPGATFRYSLQPNDEIPAGGSLVVLGEKVQLARMERVLAIGRHDG